MLSAGAFPHDSADSSITDPGRMCSPPRPAPNPTVRPPTKYALGTLLPGRIRPAVRKSGRLFRVRLGVFPERDMASNHQDDLISLYLNFVSLMNVSNASRVSSKSARWMLLMEFLTSFQTCSMGFLSGL